MDINPRKTVKIFRILNNEEGKPIQEMNYNHGIQSQIPNQSQQNSDSRSQSQVSTSSLKIIKQLIEVSCKGEKKKIPYSYNDLKQFKMDCCSHFQISPCYAILLDKQTDKVIEIDSNGNLQQCSLQFCSLKDLLKNQKQQPTQDELTKRIKELEDEKKALHEKCIQLEQNKKGQDEGTKITKELVDENKALNKKIQDDLTKRIKEIEDQNKALSQKYFELELKYKKRQDEELKNKKIQDELTKRIKELEDENKAQIEKCIQLEQKNMDLEKQFQFNNFQNDLKNIKQDINVHCEKNYISQGNIYVNDPRKTQTEEKSQEYDDSDSRVTQKSGKIYKYQGQQIGNKDPSEGNQN